MKQIMLTIMTLISLNIYGQNGAEIGVAFGFTQSGTDTHSWGNDGESLFAKTNLLYGLSASYPLSNKIKLRANWFISSIEGDDEDVLGNEARRYSYTSPLQEISLDLKWNIWDNHPEESTEEMEVDLKNSNKNLLAAYLIGGAGFSFTEPDVIYGTNPPETQRLEDENNLKHTNFQIPFGLGINYQFTNRLNLDLEARSIISMTDLLDGMSEVANSANNDYYHFVFLRLNYGL